MATGILVYEMLFGRTPFRGKNRHITFENVLHKELVFPVNIPVSSFLSIDLWKINSTPFMYLVSHTLFAKDLKSLYSLIGDFFMILRLLKNMVFK